MARVVATGTVGGRRASFVIRVSPSCIDFGLSDWYGA
jgi:hypothetical protein